MPWYLGKPGAIAQLPAPSRATQTPYERLGGTHQLLSGGRVRDSFGVKRSWQFNWQALTRDQVGVLNGFLYAAAGAGPFVLFDPEQSNLLPLNVSTGTDTTGDTTGFTIASASGIVSSTSNVTVWNSMGGPFPAIGSRTLQIGLPFPLAAFTALVNGPNVPVAVGLPYTLSAYLLSGVASYIEITWRDLSGAALSATSGTVVPQSAAGRSVATGTAPTNAAYASLVIRTNTATTGVTSMYADGIQFEQAAAASIWAPGLGVPNVSIDGANRARQQTNQNDYNLTLIEV